ncbi:Acetyltransferase (isoleucine patch superfamily) [Flavobacterium fluvii]|uniref:Acetyltransferase (Isoleucine patch superfamily) n=1 Tax=Flavobacterium fluvii TaxID=468056 RepID=A0A1M5IM32_9FLAO|nr:acyltransferase [Flavobacterium fluvii]SHG28853.1 Acetyltransferase (isoleucine patch superfamily) [Flavobacterium fluvii]
MNILVFVFKALRKLVSIMKSPLYNLFAQMQLYLNGVKFGGNIKVNGLIKVFVTRKGFINIGNSLKINSGNNYNVIGRQQKCIFWVDGKLDIGNNVGMSATAIICKTKIQIGSNVLIGGNTVIYDTDFHSLNYESRKNLNQDRIDAKSKPVIISDNVFIGAHTTILKGVTIGEGSIIGACSVVTKDIPQNEIWAGNPAKFIKLIDSKQNSI